MAAEPGSDDEDSDGCGYSDDEDQDLQPAGGQLNCWFQLNQEGLALPALGFIPCAHHPKLSNTLDRQDVFSQVADLEVADDIKRIIGPEGVSVMTANCRGEALVWDAKKTWHSAVWLDEEQLVANGIRVCSTGRDSIELRFHTLSEDEVETYSWVLLDELCQLLL